MPGEIHLRTSPFTAVGWEGSFYPAGVKPADYLAFYATKFETVEVDSMFCRPPAVAQRGHALRRDVDLLPVLQREVAQVGRHGELVAPVLGIDFGRDCASVVANRLKVLPSAAVSKAKRRTSTIGL